MRLSVRHNCQEKSGVINVFKSGSTPQSFQITKEKTVVIFCDSLPMVSDVMPGACADVFAKHTIAPHNSSTGLPPSGKSYHATKGKPWADDNETPENANSVRSTRPPMDWITTCLNRIRGWKPRHRECAVGPSCRSKARIAVGEHPSVCSIVSRDSISASGRSKINLDPPP